MRLLRAIAAFVWSLTDNTFKGDERFHEPEKLGKTLKVGQYKMASSKERTELTEALSARKKAVLMIVLSLPFMFLLIFIPLLWIDDRSNFVVKAVSLLIFFSGPFLVLGLTIYAAKKESMAKNVAKRIAANSKFKAI